VRRARVLLRHIWVEEKAGWVENTCGYPSEIGRGECAAGSYATHPYPSIIVRPQIQGFTLSRIPEACALYLQKEALR